MAEEHSSAAGRTALEWFRAQHADSATLRAGAAARVVRLDDATRGYLLVPIRDDVGLRGIVQVDALTGQVETSARIADPSAAFLMPQAQAVAIASSARPQISDWGIPYLGWQPCKESFDGTRPFWVLPHGERIIYVGQNGRIYDRLTLSGRGG